MEADHIGLMLMASAGYNPRAAPKLHKRIGGRSKGYKDCLETHPSGEERAENLSRYQVTNEAWATYTRRKRKCRGVHPRSPYAKSFFKGAYACILCVLVLLLDA